MKNLKKEKKKTPTVSAHKLYVSMEKNYMHYFNFGLVGITNLIHQGDIQQVH